MIPKEQLLNELHRYLRTIPKYLWYVNDAGNTKYTEEPNFIEETPNSITVINIILDIETQSLQSLSEFESRYSDWLFKVETLEIQPKKKVKKIC